MQITLQDGRIDFNQLDPTQLEQLGIADQSFLTDLVTSAMDIENSFGGKFRLARGSVV
jgi:hypothetical protein